eukprot:4786814-Alexandrium_andersonii.AAC.1
MWGKSCWPAHTRREAQQLLKRVMRCYSDAHLIRDNYGVEWDIQGATNQDHWCIAIGFDVHRPLHRSVAVAARTFEQFRHFEQLFRAKWPTWNNAENYEGQPLALPAETGSVTTCR